MRSNTGFQNSLEYRLSLVEKKLDMILEKNNTLSTNLIKLESRMEKLEKKVNSLEEVLNINRYSNSHLIDIENVDFSPIKKESQKNVQNSDDNDITVIENNNNDKKLRDLLTKEKNPSKKYSINDLKKKNPRTHISKYKSSRFIKPILKLDYIQVKMDNKINNNNNNRKDSYCSIIKQNKKIFNEYNKKYFSKRINTGK